MEEKQIFNKEIPPVVADNEMLSRAVYDPSFFEDGKLATTAFSLIGSDRGAETYISVLRKDYCDVKLISELRIPDHGRPVIPA